MALDLAALTGYFAGAVPPAVIERRIRPWAGAAAALIFGSAIAAAAVNRHIPKQHAGILLTLEFAASGDEVRARVPDDVRAAVLRAQRDDSRIFIPVYWALFSAAGMVLVLSGGRIPRISGWAVIAAITAAAVCDLRENMLIGRALDGASGSPAPWALAKWRLLFAIAGTLSVPLLTRSRHLRLHANGTAVLFAAACLRGLIASAGNLDAIPSATLVLAAALFFLALLFIWDSGFFALPS
jgi:hypothetical protein